VKNLRPDQNQNENPSNHALKDDRGDQSARFFLDPCARRHWPQLNPTENSVANLMLQGLSNAEISSQTGIGHQVVKNHVYHIYKKLGMHNRSQFLVRSAAESQLLNFPQPDPEGPPRILYIDDDSHRRTSMSHILKLHGYEPIVAADGGEGVSIFRDDPAIDLVILDYYMPGRLGDSVAVELKHMRPEVPILLVSGSLSLPEFVIALVDGYHDSAGRFEGLLKKITDLLRRPYAAQQLMPACASSAGPEESLSETTPLAELERLAILHALHKTHGDRLAAAKALGIGKTTLYRKLKEFDLEENHDEKSA
jgi:DNA-binding NarL/FixJ family response regulator